MDLSAREFCTLPTQARTKLKRNSSSFFVINCFFLSYIVRKYIKLADELANLQLANKHINEPSHAAAFMD